MPFLDLLQRVGYERSLARVAGAAVYWTEVAARLVGNAGRRDLPDPKKRTSGRCLSIDFHGLPYYGVTVPTHSSFHGLDRARSDTGRLTWFRRRRPLGGRPAGSGGGVGDGEVAMNARAATAGRNRGRACCARLRVACATIRGAPACWNRSGGGGRMRRGPTQTADRYPDLPQAAGAGLLLRRTRPPTWSCCSRAVRTTSCRGRGGSARVFFWIP